MATKQPTILFAGGGTGGHLFPGIAVARKLLERIPNWRLVFCGSGRAVEARIIAEHGFEHVQLPVESLAILKRRPFRFLMRNCRSARDAKRLINLEQPDAVIGLGGFASFPLVWAASKKRVPIVLMEQNVIAGRATCWLSRFANCVCTTFKDTRGNLSKNASQIVTGNPVRTEIADLSRINRETNEKPMLLVLGGSQGSHAVNQAMLVAATSTRNALSQWRIVHQAGEHDVEELRVGYGQLGVDAVVEPFFSNVADWYRQSDLIVARAGATTLAEIACAGIPAILIPYPHAARDHQVHNAMHFVERGAATMIAQRSSEQTGAALAERMVELMSDETARMQMSCEMSKLGGPDAAIRAADVISQQAFGDAIDDRTASGVHLRAG